MSVTSAARGGRVAGKRRFAAALPALAVATLVTSWFQIFWGGVVRVSKSGLGCADDWPLCNGRPYPFWEQPVLIEYTHRLIAAAISVLVAALALVVLRGHRRNPWLLGPALAAGVLIVVQVLLGAVVVWFNLTASLVMAHLATSMLFIASLGVLTVHAFPRPALVPGVRVAGLRRLPALALGGAAFTFVVLLSGANVTSNNAGAACTTWPLCGGRLVPWVGTLYPTAVQMAHRLFAYALAVVVVALYWQARKVRAAYPPLARVAALAVALVALQIAIGIAQVVNLLPAWLVAAHVGTAAAVFATFVITAALAFRTRAAAMAGNDGPGGVAGDAPPARRAEQEPSLATLYFRLTRPRVIPLLLVTTLCAMLVAAARPPSLALITVTLLAGALMSGGAHAINAYIDRDIDAEMKRTRTRPVVTGAIPPKNALWFGLILSAIGFALYLAFVNVLSALLAAAGLLFYVYVYSIWLKRRTVQNIVIGGAAGAFPPLVGWAAVSNSLTAGALVLFLIIFLWTPPHFWALAIMIRKDYEGVSIPMLPVVIGEERTARHIAAYTVALVGVTLLLAVGRVMGTLYIAVALLLGAGFLFQTLRLLRETSKAAARRVFVYSNLYLALLFAAMVLDRMLA